MLKFVVNSQFWGGWCTGACQACQAPVVGGVQW